MLKQLSLCLITISFVACGSAPSETVSHEMSVLARFPSAPDSIKTPGETCKNPDRHRYPEQIAYCERDVDSTTKREIIEDYDRDLGYQIGRMSRSQFKIDHYIPLCMGGSNSVKNLWPQHQSIYAKTDSVEQKLCILLADGRILQAEAIVKIKKAKNNLEVAVTMDRELDDLLRH